MKARYFLLWSILSCLILFSGCSRVTQGSEVYFSYRNSVFRAEIRGEIHGLPFSAEIGKADTMAADPLVGAYIRYLTPQAMQDVYLRYAAERSLFVEINGSSRSLADGIADGWTHPLSILFSESEVQSVRKEKGITILMLPQGELQLTSDGIPHSFRGKELSFELLWWETVAE